MPETKSDSLSKEFDVYSSLFHDLFFTLFQVGITLFLFVGILNLSKDKEDELYPIDLHHAFYADTDGDKGNCDLGKLRAGETAFCDGIYNIKKDEKNLAGKSIFATKLAVYAKHMGYVTSDSFSIFLLWLSYLAFDCEHFCQKMLNTMHSITRKLYYAPFILQFIIIVIIISFINNLNINTITPFIIKIFEVLKLKKKTEKENLFLEMGYDLIINLLCITLVLFLFFMVPLTIYYIVSLCKILTENLSIQMNILSVFAVFLSVKALMLFVEFMQAQFGKDAIAAATKDKEDKAVAVITSGIQAQNFDKFKSFITSYIIYFIIPILVAFSKMSKLIGSLVPNMDPLHLQIRYKIIFISIILMSFYYPIKTNLDKTFPFSIIYAVFAILSVMLIIIQNKSNLTSNP
jgi:hypothetical protein